MCLIAFAWRPNTEHRLLLAANRDELHARPSQEAHWWADNPSVLAGRDLQAGGTWLAINKRGRFATVTNYREGQSPKGRLRSRGKLVNDFLESDETALAFMQNLDADAYAGFNLLATDGNEIAYCSNRGDEPIVLAEGAYGLANASLDSFSRRKRIALGKTFDNSDLIRFFSSSRGTPFLGTVGEADRG